MTVRYLSTKGKEVFVRNVVHLCFLKDDLISILLSSGINLQLEANRIVDISIDHNIEYVIPSPQKTVSKANIWTSGAVKLNNPGPGGWGATVVINGAKKVLSGGGEPTSVQRMELMAIVESLTSLDGPHDVVLTTESRYIVDALCQGWLKKWEANNWKRENNRDIANVDLWKELAYLLRKHNVAFYLN